jgi:hypothetical protein
LRDEGSTNGTFLNDRRVTEQVLRDGDRIEFGLGGPTARFEHDAATVQVATRPSASPVSQQLHCPVCASPIEAQATELVADSGSVAFLHVDPESLPPRCEACGAVLSIDELERMVP